MNEGKYFWKVFCVIKDYEKQRDKILSGGFGNEKGGVLFEKNIKLHINKLIKLKEEVLTNEK